MRVFRGGLIGFSEQEAASLIKPVVFRGNLAILSPDLGPNLYTISERFPPPPAFFKKLCQDVVLLADRGLYKPELRPWDISAYIREMTKTVESAFLDPNPEELLSSLKRGNEQWMADYKDDLRKWVLSMIEYYFKYPWIQIVQAKELSLDDLPEALVARLPRL